MDGLGLKANSRIRPASVIEISDNSTYGAGIVVYQPPELLSDTSVQVKANLTGLGDGPYYLWVTNNLNERSSTYNLSGSSAPIKQARHHYRMMQS
jgi:hypothetical protein